MTTAIAPAAAPIPVDVPPIANTRIGKVAVHWGRDTPIYAGARTSPSEGYAGLDDALSAASRTSLDTYTGQVLVRAGRGDNARFHSFELHQPVWHRGFLRSNAYGTRAAHLAVDGYDRRSGQPEVRVHSMYGTGTDDPHGVLRTLPKKGIVGYVGGTTAVLGREIRGVDPTPPPPWKPGEAFVNDLRSAAKSVDRSLTVLGTIPVERQKDAAYDPVRKQAYEANNEAQAVLERQFQSGGGMPQNVIDELRAVDAKLEDANWQTVTRVHPKGRFHGIDIPGAIKTAREAASLLDMAIVKYSVPQPPQGQPGGDT